jgi:hypothetical protein
VLIVCGVPALDPTGNPGAPTHHAVDSPGTRRLGERSALPLARRAALAFIETYRREVGPRLQANCRYDPTCSEYGTLMFLQHGVVVATFKTVRRIMRCTMSKGSGILDPP